MRPIVILSRVVLAAALVCGASKGALAGPFTLDEPANAACASNCKAKLDTCQSDCNANSQLDEVHRGQCRRNCDQNWNFVCVRKCG